MRKLIDAVEAKTKRGGKKSGSSRDRIREPRKNDLEYGYHLQVKHRLGEGRRQFPRRGGDIRHCGVCRPGVVGTEVDRGNSRVCKFAEGQNLCQGTGSSHKLRVYMDYESTEVTSILWCLRRGHKDEKNRKENVRTQ